MSRTLEEEVARLLLEKGYTLSAAESCTGGLLGHRLTDVPGSSGFFEGGVVSYSYAAKENLLGVDHDTLLTHGAVSEEVAIQMAQGARRVFNSDYALSITGIAGPGGGMPGKPVGLVYIALSSGQKTVCQKHIWAGNRAENKSHSVDAALTLLLENL